MSRSRCAAAPRAAMAAPPPAASAMSEMKKCRAKAKPAPQFGGGRGGKGGGKGGGKPALGFLQEGLAVPSLLLAASGFMRWGASESPQTAFARGVQACRHLATSATQGGGATARTTGAAEDLWSTALAAAKAGSAGAALHHGFVCDATDAEPIVGRRLKATSHTDLDITEQARREGKLADGAGFRPVPDPAVAMRWILAGLIKWWPLLWPGRSDLFGSTPSAGLQALDLAAMSHVLLNLPTP